MRCISDEILQQYIDNELTPEQEKDVEVHLDTCSECRKRLEEQNLFVSFLRETNSSEDNVEIPAFLPSQNQPAPIRRKRYLYPIVAACCILALMVAIYPFQKKDIPENEYIILYDIEGGYDSNLPFSQQNFRTYAIDGAGNRIEIN